MPLPFDGRQPIISRWAGWWDKWFWKKGCRSEFIAFFACIWLGLSAQESPLPFWSEGSPSSHTEWQWSPAHGSPWPSPDWWHPMLQAKAQNPFASCCSWTSSWGVHSVFRAALIDGFIFQSIYLLNYPTVRKKSFLINMVISRSGWQQKHVLVQFMVKAGVPQFQFTSGFSISSQ